MNGSLDKLIEFITAHYPFTVDKFPALANASEQEKVIFPIRHLALHFGKTAGKVIGAIEPSDHGDTPNIEEIKENIPKSIVNALRLAKLVGMTEKEIVAGIEKMYGETLEG